jgi:hypothetical protein
MYVNDEALLSVFFNEFNPPFFYAPTEALPFLLKVIQDPEARAVENLSPTENAISAVTKICKYNHSVINLGDILPLWLGWLPVWEDNEEAGHVYGFLCDLIES